MFDVLACISTTNTRVHSPSRAFLIHGAIMPKFSYIEVHLEQALRHVLHSYKALPLMMDLSTAAPFNEDCEMTYHAKHLITMRL